jgi:dolichol-phosphate mannosyltransferase
MRIQAKNFFVVDAPARMKKVFAVIPTYNEADNLPHLLAELFYLEIPNLKIIIVDDGSPDGTGEIADTLKKIYQPDLQVIHRPGKMGLGSAYLEGFQTALERGADFVIQMDADFSHAPTGLPEMLEQAEQSDVVVGSRYVPGGRLDPHWGKMRYLLSWLANRVYVRLILGLQVKDATAGFKCWNRRAIKLALSHQINSNGYIFQVEMAYLAELLGLRVKEIPIYFQEREKGTSKMSNRIKLEAIWQTIQLRLQHRKTRIAVGETPAARQRLLQ